MINLHLFTRNPDTATQRLQASLALLPAIGVALLNYRCELALEDYLAILCVAIVGRYLLPLIFGGLGSNTLNPYACAGAFALVVLGRHDQPPITATDLAFALSVGSLILLALDHLRWRVVVGFAVAACLYSIFFATAGSAAYLPVSSQATALSLMPLLLARRETSSYKPKVAWLQGCVGGISYAMLCANYSPVFALLTACILSGLLLPSITELARKLNAAPRFFAASVCVLASLFIAAQSLSSQQSRGEHFFSGISPLIGSTGLMLCSLLLAGSALAGFYSRWLAPYLIARRRQRLEESHASSAATNALVLRARVTGALNHQDEF